MASPDEILALDPTSTECDSQNGYFWYVCNSKQSYYFGCCRVDPCQRNPIGCPDFARGEPLTTASPTSTSAPTTTNDESPTSSLTETATAPSPPPTPSTPSPGVPASSTISSPSTTDGDSSGHGVALSVSAIVGIVVGCGIFAIFVALMACLWWARRRREKDEKRDHAERLASSRGLDEEQLPPGLDAVFNPMTQTGPGSVFDRAEGRMMKGESVLGPSPIVGDSHFGNGTHGGIVSPLTPSFPHGTGSGLPSSPSELDSTPIHEVPSVRDLASRGDAAELDSRPVTREAVTEPRATLNSTQQERESGTYANSWTRFQNVQL